MFVGHFAVALAAKPVAPRVPLGALILAAVLADALWIPFFAVGIEQVVIQPGLMAANSLKTIGTISALFAQARAGAPRPGGC